MLSRRAFPSQLVALAALVLCVAMPTAAAPRNPSVSTQAGPEGTIAFEGSDGLYVIDAAGGKLRKIAGTLPRDGDPTWSSDGLRIAFDRGGENRDIWVMDADGSNMRRLTFAPGDDGWPQWAPHGRAITFESDRDGDVAVYVVTLSDGQARRVAGGAGYPDWRPDGRITFQNSETYDVESVRPYGKGRRVEASEDDQERWAVRISRDGQRMVFTDGRDPALLLSTARLDGSDSKRVLRGTQDIVNPAWSPDGQWITFSMGSESRLEVYVVRTDGRELTRLTTMAPRRMACCSDWGP
jgi:TolB protein